MVALTTKTMVGLWLICLGLKRKRHDLCTSDLDHRIVAGSQSAICGKIITSAVVMTIDTIRMLVPL